VDFFALFPGTGFVLMDVVVFLADTPVILPVDVFLSVVCFCAGTEVTFGPDDFFAGFVACFTTFFFDTVVVFAMDFTLSSRAQDHFS
jgi:hypothetical protein